jgi:tetrahydromethanopterin S-methyltransferase subunit H
MPTSSPSSLALRIDSSAGGLLDFLTEQSIFEIGGVRVGGRPRADPTVLIGSVFYHGHKVCRDESS